ncbi:MAG: pilus assembly protein TadG-related protein [Micrococcaceae bacterium]
MSSNDENGSGTIQTIGILLIIVIILLTLTTLTKVLLNKHEANHKTDAAALAASDTLLGFIEGDICANAQKLLTNNMTLTKCHIGETEVWVTTIRPTIFNLTITSNAHAGLPETN